jgi:bifunctional DNA-binding transcriptional regulator/antitoxin component of YhaV-PrlF toxin-antitoxin module
MDVLPPLPPDSTAASDGFDEMRAATVFVGPGGTVVLPDWLRQEMGLKEGSCLSAFRDKERVALLPITDDLIRKVRGAFKGNDSLLEDRERDHRIEKHR